MEEEDEEERPRHHHHHQRLGFRVCVCACLEEESGVTEAAEEDVDDVLKASGVVVVVPAVGVELLAQRRGMP